MLVACDCDKIKQVPWTNPSALTKWPNTAPAQTWSEKYKGYKGYKGYKDGLQPESLADGKLAGETKSTSVEDWN